MASNISLPEKLSNALPLPTGVNLTLYHLSTPPTKSSRAIFAAPPGEKEQTTFCESHFLAVTVPSPTLSEDGVLALAAEVLVFTTFAFTLIFVSKVDTTGYLYVDKVPKGRDISKIVLSTFLAHLLDARSHSSKVVLSLFARAEDQYLFPGSGKNGAKRVVGDRALVKWWCRVLDPVLRSSDFSRTSEKVAHTKPTAHVLVAGSEANERKNILPSSSFQDPPDQPQWLWSYPADLLAPSPSAPSQCLIPRLPDDPKTRYLEELDEEVEKHGHWTSIETVAQFWEVMDTRKECAAGRAVGYVWMIFPSAKEASYTNGHVGQAKTENVQINGGESSVDRTKTGCPTCHRRKKKCDKQHPQCNNCIRGGFDCEGYTNTKLVFIQKPSIIRTPALARPEQSQLNDTTNVKIPTTALEENVPPVVQTASPPTSSPGPMSVDPKGAQRSFLMTTATPEYYDETRQIPVPWPRASRGNRIISEEQYQIMMDELLQLDFDNQDLAKESTKAWIAKGSSFFGQSTISDWGDEIQGRGDSAGAKRKVDETEGQSETVPAKPTINILSAGLVRKKPKLR